MFGSVYFVFSQEMDEEVLRMQTDEIVSRARLLDNEIKVRLFMFYVADLAGKFMAVEIRVGRYSYIQ